MYKILIYLFAAIFLSFFILEIQRLRKVSSSSGERGNILVMGSSGPIDSGLSINDELSSSNNLWSADRIIRALASNASINDSVIDKKTSWSSQQIAETLIDFSESSLSAIKDVKNNNIPMFKNAQLFDSGYSIDDNVPSSSQIIYSSMKNDEMYLQKLKRVEGKTGSTLATIIPDGSLLDSNIEINDLEGPSDTILWTSSRAFKSWVSARVDAITSVKVMTMTPLMVTVIDDPMNQWNVGGVFRPRRTGFYLITFRFFASSFDVPVNNFLTLLLTRRAINPDLGGDTLFQLSFPITGLFMCNGSEVIQINKEDPEEELTFTLASTFECSIDNNGSLHIQEL